MRINWRVRINNKAFWITMIPAVLVLAQFVLSLFGINIDISSVEGRLIAVVDALFVVLTMTGVINDPTTVGFDDSARAMTYEVPSDSPEEKG